MYLSKSKYCNAFQCMKLLWLNEYKPEEKEDINNSSVLENGTEVGEYAKKLFGEYIDIEFNKDLSKMIEDTKKAINDNKSCIITEASFSYNNNFCSVDILKKNNNSYEIYEVKSSTDVKDIYIEDVSYQYYVLTKLGLNVTKACIVYLNRSYERNGELDLNKLFIIKDITSTAKEKLVFTEDKIKEINKYMENTKEENKDIGMYCFDPYKCPFFSYCTKHLEKPNVFDVAKMNKKEKLSLYYDNKTSFKDLINESLKPSYLEQIDFELNNRPPKIDKEKILEFLSTLTYPLYFLDFETYQQSIPLYDGVKPYDQIPFQYSLHYIETPGGEVKHKEFLGDGKKDPRKDLTKSLINDIPENVCILAYNMSFEKTVIKDLSERYSEYKDHLLNIIDNIKDLMIPFINRSYYTKEMEGSYSIKYVLPALFPNEPSLNYHNLEEVHNGSEAMNSYKTLDKLSKEEQDKLRSNLLKYCSLDTYAMVKIYEKLIEVTK